MDRGSAGRRSGQVLAIREKLLALPEGEFDLAIKTIERMVVGKNEDNEVAQKEKTKAQRKEALELFDRVNNSGKNLPPDKISRV